MITLNITDRDGAVRAVQVLPGRSLMRTLKAVGYDIDATCVGTKGCATCHVHVDAAWAARLPVADQDEIDLLESTEAYVAGRSRLSCQVPVTPDLDGLAATLAAED